MIRFSVKKGQENKDKWIVCKFPNYNPFIKHEFENIEFANEIAEKLNDVYKSGFSDCKMQVMDNLEEVLFRD